jgi:hypothetical protein
LAISGAIPTPVSHRDPHRRVIRRLVHEFDARDDLAVIGELDRVADEIRNHLSQPEGVAAHRHRRARGQALNASSLPLAAAGCANIANASSAVSTRLKSMASSSRWPNSIFEKSKMSLMTPNKCRLTIAPPLPRRAAVCRGPGANVLSIIDCDNTSTALGKYGEPPVRRVIRPNRFTARANLEGIAL